MPAERSSLTIRQLAQLAGVSKSTASLAMQNHPRLSAKTREHVRKIAAKHGYTPDPLTSRLMNHLRTARRWRSVEKLAYLTWWDTPDAWLKDKNSRDWYEGARSRAEALGYELEPIWGKEPGISAARLSKILYTRAIRGAVITPLPRPRGHLSLDWQHLATAIIGYSVVKPDLHRISHHHYNGISLALRRLAHGGYQRIGLANLADQSERVNHGWLAGYLVHEQGIAMKKRIPPLLLKTWDRQKFIAWLERHNPDAIVSNSSYPLRILREQKYAVPGNIGYAHLDVTTAGDTCAGIDQQPGKVAAAAVDLVIGQLQRNESGLPDCPTTIHLDGVWRDGATIKQRRN